MTTPRIPAPVARRPLLTTPVPEAVEEARRLIAAVLDGDPGLDHALVLSEALLTLSDVHPPYPPVTDDLDPLDLGAAMPRIRAALDRAAAYPPTETAIRDLARYTHVSTLLTSLERSFSDLSGSAAGEHP